MMAPPLAGSPRIQGHRDYVIKVLLHGLTGPLAGRTYTQVMLPMGAQKDDWIAAVASHVRNDFGNSGTFVMPADVARVRAATSGRKTMWTVPELEASLPVLLQPEPSWKVTASHNVPAASDALTIVGWASGAPQQAGMWVQVELPQPLTLTEVQFNTPAGRGGPPPAAAGAGTRGGGAGGAGGTQAPPAPAREYQLQVSMDGKKWTPAASGPIASLTVAAFPPLRAKFVRLTQTAPPQGAGQLVIQNIRLYQAPERR
jgi:hypothetical protein